MQLLIFICFVAAAFAAGNECPDNSHYDKCGTACPLTCENYLNPPKFCVKICKHGCHCDEGYVKTKDGLCVLPEECPECPDNSHYAACGTACPLTCDNYSDPPLFCVKRCKRGCECDEGYVKTKDGRCVLPEQCAECPDNSHYDKCGTACPLTCENYLNPPKFCVKICKHGCHCDEGYVKTKDGLCVLPEECPVTEPALDRPDCDKGPEPGLCKAHKLRYYYDQEAGMCKTFFYGGCGGNRNNFHSEFECYNKCGALAGPSACRQEKEVGPCRAGFERFYFNTETNKCEAFIYGGCQGNSNNFNSQRECENVCINFGV